MRTGLALLAVLGALAADEKKPRGGLVPWRTDVDHALADAKNGKKPVVMYFTHDR